jgi:putative ABC transport system substrate-binding protein
LAALAPAIVLASTTPAVTAIRIAARTVSVVFAQAIDPVRSGLVASLARPGANATGFTVYEYPIAAKWLELLKEAVPGITRAAVVRDPAVAAGISQFAAIQIVAPLGIELSVIGPQEDDALEQTVAAFAREPNGGLIVTGKPICSQSCAFDRRYHPAPQAAGCFSIPLLCYLWRPDFIRS